MTSKIHFAGGRLCHLTTLWFRGGGRAPASKDSHLCWHKTAGGCCARQHKCVLVGSTNRLGPVPPPQPASVSTSTLQPPLRQIHFNKAIIQLVLARRPHLHLGFDLESLLLPLVAGILLLFGRPVCSSAASSILLQPTLPPIFHRGVSVIDASTAPRLNRCFPQSSIGV
jgi:hypothetical protein